MKRVFLIGVIAAAFLGTGSWVRANREIVAALLGRKVALRLDLAQ